MTKQKNKRAAHIRRSGVLARARKALQERKRENRWLDQTLAMERREHREFKGALSGELPRVVLQYCHEEIVNEILQEAIKAADIVGRQTMETGDYEIGITIPELHIRKRVARLDLEPMPDRCAVSDTTMHRVRHIDVRMFEGQNRR